MKAIRLKAAELAFEKAYAAHGFTAHAMDRHDTSSAAMWRNLTVRFLLVREYCKVRNDG